MTQVRHHLVGGEMRYLISILAVALALPIGPISTEPELHCAVAVIGHSQSGQLVTSRMVCRRSAAMAIEDVQQRQSMMRDGVVWPTASRVLASHYSGKNGTGSSISIIGTRCSGGYWNATGGWRDTIESTRHSQCSRVRHYASYGRAGTYEMSVGPGIVNLVSMANRVESVSYHG